MPHGTEVDLGPGDIVLDGDPAPPRKGAHQLTIFRPVCFVSKRYTHLLLATCWIIDHVATSQLIGHTPDQHVSISQLTRPYDWHCPRQLLTPVGVSTLKTRLHLILKERLHWQPHLYNIIVTPPIKWDFSGIV